MKVYQVWTELFRADRRMYGRADERTQLAVRLQSLQNTNCIR